MRGWEPFSLSFPLETRKCVASATNSSLHATTPAVSLRMKAVWVWESSGQKTWVPDDIAGPLNQPVPEPILSPVHTLSLNSWTVSTFVSLAQKAPLTNNQSQWLPSPLGYWLSRGLLEKPPNLSEPVSTSNSGEVLQAFLILQGGFRSHRAAERP